MSLNFLLNAVLILFSSGRGPFLLPRPLGVTLDKGLGDEGIVLSPGYEQTVLGLGRLSLVVLWDIGSV